MVVFDAHFLMLALKPEIPCSVENSKERVQKLLKDLSEARERIIIPTPALAEFLVRADTEIFKYLEQVRKSSQFRICPFGHRAAVEVSLAISAALTRKDKRGGNISSWAKVKFDWQIVAIGKVEGAHTIYTDDKGMENFSSKLNIRTVRLADLPLPDEDLQKSLF